MGIANTIRAFIAINLSPEIKDKLIETQTILKKANADVKWVRPEAMHITLKFLGNISQENITDIKKAITKVSSGHKAFELSIFQIGGFPSLENPRVIWMGIDKGLSRTEAMAKEIENGLIKLGFKGTEHPFSAHLTLGRIKSSKGKRGLVSMIKTLDFKQNVSCVIDKLILFSSTLTPHGAFYTPLYEARLLHK